jgi:murein DD-endopeptidase MepM/ murein hydrolase activator NlpD
LPVGDPVRLGQPSGPGEPAFQLNRGVERSKRRVTHQGDDLSDGRDGDPVRAAASGIVVLTQEGDNGDGYGSHVVIAHRLAHGAHAYTVYAHLLEGSVEVEPGDIVEAGDRVGLVGQTGRASTPHLHFEVRDVRDLSQRWELTNVREPIRFVARHAHERAGSPGRGAPALDAAESARAYTAWAEREGLLEPGGDAGAPLTRAQWWRMLAGTAANGPDTLLMGAAALRDSLVELGILPEESPDSANDAPVAWVELARDTRQLRTLGVRLGHGPLEAARHAAACKRLLGLRSPGAHPASLKHRRGSPTLAEGCVVIADLCPPAPEAPRRSRHPASAHRRQRRAGAAG